MNAVERPIENTAGYPRTLSAYVIPPTREFICGSD